jgi:hypothetical protein
MTLKWYFSGIEIFSVSVSSCNILAEITIPAISKKPGAMRKNKFISGKKFTSQCY